ncbi:MAG: hypothetical protein EOP21_00585 [Hyphomicrobiales bacterium]|nr:MAG: hypothetical protein EOP21_00585 [Hyphomicrobiales bacterium]
MPLLIILRFLFGLLSLVLLAVGAYLLWQWYQGDLVQQPDGDVVRIRTDWFLWVAVALGVFSLLGRLPLGFLLAKPDTDPSKPHRNKPRHSGPQRLSQATGYETTLQAST